MARKAAENGADSARSKLFKKAGKKEAAKAAKKDDRPVVSLEGEMASALDRYTASDKVVKAMKGHQGASKDQFLPFGKQKTFEEWIAHGGQTENIKFQTRGGASIILQVKDVLTGARRGFRVPKDEDGEPMDVKEHLRRHGVADALIERLVGNEEFVDTETMFIPMAKLEKDHPDLAERLINLIVAANEGGVTTKGGKKIKFSDEEMEHLVEAAHDVTVQAGFLGRIVPHVKAVSEDRTQQVEMLSAVLTAIPPDWAMGSVQPGLNQEEVLRSMMVESGTGDERTAAAVATATPPPAPPSEHVVANGKYTLRVNDLQVTVIRNTDQRELAKKQCEDAGHVRNTIRQWREDSAALSAFISENV